MAEVEAETPEPLPEPTKTLDTTFPCRLGQPETGPCSARDLAFGLHRERRLPVSPARPCRRPALHTSFPVSAKSPMSLSRSFWVSSCRCTFCSIRWGHQFRNHPLGRCKILCQLTNAGTLRPQRSYPSQFSGAEVPQSRSANSFSCTPGLCHPCFYSFPQQFSLKLCHRPKNRKR